ncbi:UDP-N-acetylglucosamine 2-epimerase (hydrolyzing) [Sulfurimonas sediminis]|uniref:UDP-N-acetylglucosamine 2-epimerase (Hydrolyzing) n=1 Tax=Sulfurimonas sediminis TaxID=2590020 RepID=A0A7M1AYS5_9BACT|nr:UDP-N-acetylglucosamine 2-epimerase [Sulfurimonas sediminis]QOP42604.1 UDP-N-acetylglucosamine 2-epimerase (hydrolyzing) [Sulfurimonas sediminis]
MKKRKIAVITTTRAEYGLLKPLMQEIQQDDALILQLIVSGTHVSKEYGETFKEIEKDFSIDAKVPFTCNEDAKEELSCAMAQLQCEMTHTLTTLGPDIVVILGDRYEILSCALAAFMLCIPIAHIHGGEITEGAIDDSLRHSVTKLAALHFTSTEVYKKRVIQLGEEPQRVFNVGSLGVENIKKMQLLSKKAFEKSINFTLGKKNLLVTFHPQTLSELSPAQQFQSVLEALANFKDIKIIFTKANADAGGKIINTMIDNYVQQNREKAIAFHSLGQLRYFSAIKYVDAVVGNSSSGILEVPSFHKTTVNIGERQKGRVQAKSIINCSIDTQEISYSIQKIYDSDWQKQLQNIHNPYEGTQTADSIKKTLATVLLDQLKYKIFYDIKV